MLANKWDCMNGNLKELMHYEKSEFLVSQSWLHGTGLGGPKIRNIPLNRDTSKHYLKEQLNNKY